MSVVDKIQHYQRSLERCTDNGSRTLHCIEKLYRLPVTVQHLQETGVGRTVNALRKYDGSIGDAAKALVAKWKTMVVDEDTSDGEDEDEACVPDAPEGYSDHSNSPKPEKKNTDDASKNSSKHRSNELRNKSQGNEKHESRHGTKNSSSVTSKTRENETKTSRETNNDKEKCTKNGIDKKQIKNNDSIEMRIEKKSKSTRESKNECGRRESSREESSNRGTTSTSSKTGGIKPNDGRKNSSRVSSSSGSSNHSGTTKSTSKYHDSRKKRKLDDSSSERETSKRRKSLESSVKEEREDDSYVNEINANNDNYDDNNDDDDDDRPTQILSRDSDNDTEKILPDTSFETDSDDNTPKIKIKRETSDSPPFYERSSDDSRNSQKIDKSKSKNREISEKSTSSSSEKSRRDSEKRERSKNDRDKSEHRKSEKRKDDTTRSSSKESSSKSRSQNKSSSSSKNLDTSKDNDESRESSKSKRENMSDSDSKKSNEKFKEPKDKKVKKKKINGDGGIDCNSGASFAEALGMCTDRPSLRKKNPVSPSSPVIKTIKTEPGTSSSALPSSNKSSIKIKTEYPATNDTQSLSLLAPNVKLEPLNVDLASTLPEISPNYKPLPANYVNSLHRKQDEDKALSDVIYSRGQRTKVYSGNKSGYLSVPSLCEVCIRVLIQHMDALGFTGGIPYDILKPVLERAMPDQLFTLENYNPYLIEDTDCLWQFHCNREFREKQREEMESWRDMYMRCRDEREVKLKALTANIKESIDKSVPVRSTKLAYVDNVVKPPRNVLRNQAKYGTAKSSTPLSDLKKKLILSGGSNSATNISVPPPPMSRMKSSQASSSAKKNKAPLMAKALQLIKARYKR